MGLQVDYDSLRRETGFYLGYDRDPANYSLLQGTDVKDVLAKAMRWWYFPAIADGIYRWSFLRKTFSLPLVVNTFAYDLPNDFAGLVTECFNFDHNQPRPRVTRIGEEQLLSLQSSAWLSRAPQYFCIRAKGTLDGGRALHEVLFYPTPDDTLNLNLRYITIPPELSDDSRFPLGGEVHGETILEACLACAEQKVEDAAGVHTAAFQQLLAASIKIDMDIAR